MKFILGAAALLAGAQALAQAGGKKPPPETPLSRCVQGNRQVLTDVGEALEAARRRHVLSPLVVTRLQGLEVSLTRLRDGQARLKNVADCEQSGQAIAAEKERLQRIAGPDPEVAECLGDNQKMHAAILQGYEAVQRSGRLPADQAAAFQAAGQRLNELGAALAKEGQLLADCKQLAERVAQERNQVERWVAAVEPASTAVAAVAPGRAAVVPAPAPPPSPPPPPAAPPAPAGPSPEVCREGQARTYNELAAQFASLAQGSSLPIDKVSQFQSLSERLTRLRGLIADRSAPGWDCAGVNQGLAQVRNDLQPLLRK